MQRRDSLGSTTKIPRLSKGSTRKFKTRRSQTSFSSASDAFAEDESTKGQPDLSVSEMKLRSEKNLDGNQGRSAEAGPASETLVDPFDEGERTLIRPDFEPDEVLEREEVERTEETSERPEVEPREEVLYRGMSKSETKSYKWRKEPSHPTSTHSSLAKQSNNAMMSSMSPGEEQTFSKAKKSWKSLYDERVTSLQARGLSSSYDQPEITHPDVNFTPCPRNDMSREASSASPTRPMSDGITMGASSTFDRLMTSMHKQKGGASSSTRLQPQLTSSSLGLTPPLGAAGDISDMFAGVMNGLDELRRDMTKRIDQVDERAHHGRESLKDELTHVKSQARFDQAQLIRNTDQCLAESLAQANKESEEREARMTREIERLLNDHDNTYAQTMTGLEKRLDAKSDLMMRKLDAILNGSSWQEHSNSRERSRHANVGDGTGNSARAQQGSRTNYEHRNKERPRAAPQRPGWTNPVPPEADATPETRLPTVPQVSSVPDLTTVSQDTTMYASMFEPLNRSLETFITKLSKSTERGERSRRTLKKPKSYKDESDGCIDTWIEVMKLHFEEKNLSKKQECSALTSNLEGTALSCVMAKRANERDSARKIFDILLNRFGSGVQGHQAMVKFEKRRQRDEESIDKFLDDLELLRRRSNPDERISERNLAIASKFMDGVRSEELKTMLATHFTLLLDQVPTPDDLRMKSREYLLIKPRAQNCYSNYGNYSGTNTGACTGANSSWYKPRDDMDKRRSCANCGSMDHHVSACSAYKQNMKAIGYFLEDADATDEDHEEYVRGLIMKYGARCFFCNLEGHFKSDCIQFWDAVADAKHPRHEEALSGVKASRARLMNEAESRRKETTPSTFTTKKVKTWPDEVVASNLEAESSSPLKVDYGLAARTALQNVKQDLATKEVEQWVRSELESTDLRESFNVLGKTTKAEDKEEPKKQGLKLNVISGKTFGMTKAGTKIMSIISVAGHQVVKNLSEPSEITLVHLDIYADYLKEKDPKLDSRAVRALLTMGCPRLMKVDGHYIDVHGPYPILMNVDGINIYTKAHITDANDQIGRIYIGQEELKVRRIGHNPMLEQDAVHIGCEADLAAHVLDVQGRQLSVNGLLDTGAVVSVMPVKTWTDMGFERSDLIPTNIRLAAANQGAIYVTGRTPIISLQLGGRHLWMSFLVVENLDESDQLILGRDFVRNFDVTIDLNDGLIRIKDPERKYEKRPFNKILINQAKVPIFLDRKVRLKPNQAVVATFRMRNLNELSNDRQVCLVPNPNSKSSAILGRSFSLTQSGLCVNVLLNTEATTVTIQRGKKLGYALPLNTDFQSVENLKKFDVTKCQSHANQECIMKRVNELKSSSKLFSMKSETDDGLSSCSNFPERPTEAELAANKPVLPEIEHLKGKISDKELDSLRAVLNRNADVFSKHKADIGCCNFVEHEIEIEEGSVPHREGARRMTPNKSEACRKEIEMLREYDMIEPSKSPWACGVVMAKKKGGQLRFCCDFRYLNAVTIKDAYPIPRIDESLSKLGDAKFFTTLDLGSAFWQVPLRKQDREKTGFACELGLFQWKRMPFGLCNATATFQRLMAQALTSVTKKYGNLIMCYADDVGIATPTLEDHIERLEEVLSCMKQAGLKCKPSKCEILRDSIKYLGRLVDKHGVRPDPEAVEAVLTWKAPKTDTQLMSFLGFANYYREFIKGYADKIYPMQRLMRNKGKKFTWTDEAQVSFENIKRELCEAPVLGMPTEKGMFVLDTDASVVAISGIHCCPITSQSDNGKAFVGDLTKELMKRSQVAQAHSTTYHPQTNGLVERQNRTLVSMLRVYCSRYMDDWDKHLPQVMGAYNSTEHSTTGISPHMMLTGHEKALPLTFFYPEYEGKRTAPQTYVRDVIRRQQDLNDLCRRNTQQAQIRQKRRFDKRTADAKAYSVGDYVWVFQEVVPPKGTKKLLKKWRGPFQITEVHQGGRFYRLSTGRAAHYENIKPHNASSEDWCIPADMQEGDYLIVDPACEVNERGTRDKNDGNEVVDDCDLPLDLELTERVEVDDETLLYAEEDWDCPEQTENDKGIQPDFPLTMETRQSKRGKNQKNTIRTARTSL